MAQGRLQMADRLQGKGMLGAEIDAARRPMLEPRRLVDQAVAIGAREGHARGAPAAGELGRNAQQLGREGEGGMGRHDDAEMLARHQGLELGKAAPLGQTADQRAQALLIGAGIAFAQPAAQPVGPLDEGGQHEPLDQLLQRAQAELALVQAPPDIQRQELDRIGIGIFLGLAGQLCQPVRQAPVPAGMIAVVGRRKAAERAGQQGDPILRRQPVGSLGTGDGRSHRGWPAQAHPALQPPQRGTDGRETYG